MPRYKIDLGLDGGGGGPWLSWHPQASRNGERAPNTWSLRSADGDVSVTDAPIRGFVLDLEMIRTGWESASGRSGVAPERRWNVTADSYGPQPGEDWKRAFSLPVALTRDQRATWEQASLASRIALDDLCKLLEADPVDHGEQVPCVRQTGTKLVRTAGGNTVAPILTLMRWVDRPGILDRPDGSDDETLLPGHAEALQQPDDAEPAEEASDWDAEPPAPARTAERLRAAMASKVKVVRAPRKRGTAAQAQTGTTADPDLNDVIPF